MAGGLRTWLGGRPARLVRRSRTAHGLAKWATLAPTVAPRQWLDARRTIGIVRVLPNTMLSAPRLLNAYDVVRQVEDDGVDGAIVECGVWSGGGIGLMALASRRYGTAPRTFHLFDSFEGLPQPSVHDEEVLAAFALGHPELVPDDGSDPARLVAIGACEGDTIEAVRDLFLRRLRVAEDRVVIHAGWFQDTVPAAAATIGPIAVLRLDGDWYESTKVCIENLYDHVAEGGFVIVDDYGDFTGCRKAVDEFLASRGESPDLLEADGAAWFRKVDAR
jgi:hypothetical protein